MDLWNVAFCGGQAKDSYAAWREEMMRILDTLTTSHKTYTKIPVFETAAEAGAAGYHVLSHDEQARVTIYGKPIDTDYPKVLMPAAVFDEDREDS